MQISDGGIGDQLGFGNGEDWEDGNVERCED